MADEDQHLTPLLCEEWLRAADMAFSHERVGDRLGAIALLRAHLPVMERDAVEQAIAAGWTWAAIASRLALSRQAVHRRYAGSVDVGRPWRRRYRRLELELALQRGRDHIRELARRAAPEA